MEIIPVSEYIILTKLCFVLVYVIIIGGHLENIKVNCACSQEPNFWYILGIICMRYNL